MTRKRSDSERQSCFLSYVNARYTHIHTHMCMRTHSGRRKEEATGVWGAEGKLMEREI